MAGINTEVWAKDLQKRFTSDEGVINVFKDYSALVNYSVIHLPQGSNAVTVRKNLDQSNANTVATKEKQSITDLTVTLDKYTTDVTVLPDEDTWNKSVNLRAHYLENHYLSLKEAIQKDALISIVPTANGDRITFKTTGAGASGVKAIKADDIIKMAGLFDINLIPQNKRYVVLNTNHLMDLQTDDVQLYRQIANEKTIYGFNVLRSESIVGFDKANGNAKTTGADSYGSIFLQADCVGKAMSAVKVYTQNNDPHTYGSNFSALVRFKAFNTRPAGNTVGIGIIYS